MVLQRMPFAALNRSHSRLVLTRKSMPGKYQIHRDIKIQITLNNLVLIICVMVSNQLF